MSRTTFIVRSLAVSSLLAGSGCMLGPDHTRPAIATPIAWKENAPAETAPIASPLPVAWWTVFDDAELNALEARVLASNHDLKRAIARVTEARALARLSSAEFLPTLSGRNGYSRQRLSENRANSGGQKLYSDDHSIGLDLSYELDFWGRVRRSNEAAFASAAATEDDFYALQLILTADTARTYLQLQALDHEKTVIEATLALRRDAVRLQETRNQAGLINEVDVTRARTEVANVEAELYALTRSRARLEHALAVLCGETASAFSVTTRPWKNSLPAIPIGLPSSLLERRPDIAAAEQQLHATTALIGVAKADFFPRIALTASAGLASADLGSLLERGSRAGSFGSQINLPIFDGGRARANHKAAEARYEQSVATYHGTVLNAFREVEDALSDVRFLSFQIEAVNRALTAARDTAILATERYTRGLSNYLDVVDAQRGVFQAERQATQLHAERAIATILLAKALGGGWDRTESLAAR